MVPTTGLRYLIALLNYYITNRYACTAHFPAHLDLPQTYTQEDEL